jgi:uncharacterized SAM-binding protein YcdF (DUF218 family)
MMRLFFLVTGTVAGLLALQACAFSSKTTKRMLKQARSERYDLIVVPGVQFENAQWSRTMKARVYWSKYLYDQGIAKNIMYSGAAVYSPYIEARIMALYAEAIGIPRERIFVETKAEHSTENIYYSYKKARNLGFSKIALASDPFQTKLLRRFTRRKVSSDVGLIPIVFDTLRAMEPMMTDPVIDHHQTINDNFIHIGEREGFFKRFRGTLGRNVDTAAYRMD